MIRTLDGIPKKCLSGIAAVTLVVGPAFAQDTNQPTQLEPTIVTGSYIPTAETVGVAPVDIVGTSTIERVGRTDVLDTLKKVTPSFSGSGNVGQTLNNGGGGEAYIALRNLPTLVLLDGRRLANSAFSSGALVDLNTIPLAAIERIEVLKDGASVLYGSDAIGGVINIITKKNWSGFEVGGRYGFATGDGTVEENRAYIVGGVTTDKASFSAGAQYYYMDPLLSRDREVASMGLSDLLAEGIMPGTQFSPSFPGRVQSGGVSYILAGSEFAVGAPGYNPAITRPPSPNNPVVAGIPYVPGTYTTVPAYLAAHPGVYIPISSTPIGQQITDAYAPLGFTGEQAGWPLLNTTLLGVPSIQSQDRRQFFANGSYDLFEKRATVFSEFLYANTKSTAALAPAPMSSLSGANITISGDAPVNPFGIDLGAQGAASPRVRSRFYDVGSRQYENINHYYHFVGGLKGQFESDWNWAYETAFNYNLNDQVRWNRNSPNGAALVLATLANPDPAAAASGLSQLYDADGPVPLFDPFALPGGNDPRTIAMLRGTQVEEGQSELWGPDARFTAMLPFELPAGRIGVAFGGGFYRESFFTDVDGLTVLGQWIGQNQQYPMPPGRRDAYNGWIETRIPVTSPDMDIPALYSLELTAAGRYEYFDPGGDSAVPKVGIRWQPLDKQLTLRASYSQSFLAPNVWQLFGAPVISFDTVRAGGIGQVQMNWVSSPELTPAEADNVTAGFVLSPKAIPGLTLSVDYYHIQTENDVYRVGAQAVADDLMARGVNSEFAPSFLFSDFRTRLGDPAAPILYPDGVTIANWGKADRPFRNGAEQETDGLDITLAYELQTENWGKFNPWASANVLFNYTYADPVIGGPYHYEGQFTDNGPAGGAQGNLPDFVMTMGVSWNFHNFTYTVVARYVPEVDDVGDLHESNDPAPGALNGYTVSGLPWVVDSYYSIDMQLAYEFKAEGKWYDQFRVALGVNNITDTDVPLIASSSEDNTDKGTYDLLGRFVYVELSKKF